MTQNRRLSKTFLSGTSTKQRGIWNVCFDDVTRTWRVWRQQHTPGCWQPPMIIHGVTTETTCTHVYLYSGETLKPTSLPSIGRQHSATGPRRRRQHVLSKHCIHPQQNCTASSYKRPISKCVLKLKPQILCQCLLWVGNSPTETWRRRRHVDPKRFVSIGKTIWCNKLKGTISPTKIWRANVVRWRWVPSLLEYCSHLNGLCTWLGS